MELRAALLVNFRHVDSAPECPIGAFLREPVLVAVEVAQPLRRVAERNPGDAELVVEAGIGYGAAAENVWARATGCKVLAVRGHEEGVQELDARNIAWDVVHKIGAMCGAGVGSRQGVDTSDADQDWIFRFTTSGGYSQSGFRDSR